MGDPRSWLADFYSTEAPRVLAALGRLAESSGVVNKLDVWRRNPGEKELRGVRQGIFAPEIFGGDSGRFGHVETAGVFHPAAMAPLERALRRDRSDLEPVLRGEMALRGDALVPESDAREGDLIGRSGLAEALRRVAPDHPALPLCAITKIPVPPIDARPPRKPGPTRPPGCVDPWIGPENEAWLRLIEHAYRDARLRELDAPPIIVTAQENELRKAFERVFDLTCRAYAPLVPGLVRALDRELTGLAFVDERRLLVQRGDRVTLVDLHGRELRRFGPAGCTLRGVVGRHAVFQGILQGIFPGFHEDVSMWPSWFARVDEEGIVQVATHVDELSVLDVEEGSYLATRPPWVPEVFVVNDQPEDLFLGPRRLYVGGDRPTALAYSPGLHFVWVGEDDDTQILELETGLPAAYPAFVRDAPRRLNLASGESREDAFENDESGASALVFADGNWLLLSSLGILTDHLGREPLQLAPAPRAAAFAPSGKHLAVAFDEEIAIVDPRARTVVARFP